MFRLDGEKPVPSERANRLAKAVFDLVDARAALEETYDYMSIEEESRLRKQDFDNAIMAFEAEFDAAVETKALQLLKQSA